MINKYKSIKYILKGVVANSQVIGYPKSGNTWLRMLICNSFIEKHNLRVNDAYFDESRINLRNKTNIIFSHGTRDRRIKSMSDQNIDPIISKRRKTIFLVRDPRDVLVSLFYHEVYRYGKKYYTQEVWQKMFLLEKYSDLPSFSGFVRGEIRGINYIVDFMNYWYQNKKNYNNFMIVSYEDLHNTTQTLQKIFSFLSISIDENCIENAVNESSFNKMRVKELSSGMESIDLGVPSNISDTRTYKVRKGKVGGYKQELFSQDDLAYVDSVIKKRLNPAFNY